MGFWTFVSWVSLWSSSRGFPCRKDAGAVEVGAEAGVSMAGVGVWEIVTEATLATGAKS